ncbi:MAG: hypothetical protein Q9M36_09625 [Sulfurovum sp.]|nr:hypothetical protein [Sulfurovum sp.]
MNGRINEMVWTDENNDGTIFPFVWQGTMAIFDSDVWRVGEGFTGGHPRVQNGKAVMGAELLCATSLRSTLSDTRDISDKEAILFVHGFINSGKLGGYDHGGGEVGGEYFAKFPNILENYKGENTDKEFIPFVFQWRTNAKFEDVADDLGRAIKQIVKQTGKKVHIVAHSFGGLLSRTLIQGQSTMSPYHNDFSEKHIASLTTVGTPHSGVFGSKTTFTLDNKPLTFPEGRQGFIGALIENCQAITCYQAGNSVSLLNRNQALYGTDAQYGTVIHRLFSGLVNYPNIPTQALIGVVPESVSGTTNLFTGVVSLSYDFFDDEASQNPGAGDNLISIFGQRIVPDADQDDLDGMYNENHIEEHILPMDGRSSVFYRGVDDWIVNEYSLGVINDSWNIDDYRTDLTKYDLEYFASGYNHRTGQYKVNHEAVSFYKIDHQSEVGLQGCTDSMNCNHSTWNYFKTFLDNYPSEDIVPPSTYNVPHNQHQKK